MFLHTLPADTGMGFVLVQHLEPSHASVLAQLLAPGTSMPVHEVTNDTRVEPNQIYAIPPNVDMMIIQGVLKLVPRERSERPHLPINRFLQSLAEDRREWGIGVILSGAASDGTTGLEAIKAEGGITFAQDATAKYDSMPRSAVASGCVDFVLSPEKIAEELARIAKHPYFTERMPPEGQAAAGAPPLIHVTRRRGKEPPLVHAGEGVFKKIFGLLRRHSQVDFTLYRPNTIRRRIRRRMVLGKHLTLEAYAAHLQRDAAELEKLYQDLLISVTHFFRDPEAFELLKEKVFPKLLEGRSPDDAVRVWVTGCSTGQEAYSIAIAFLEYSSQVGSNVGLLIFATDLNETLLDKARIGFYAKSLVQEVSPERLRRFFIEEHGGFRVSKSIRELCVFAKHNVLADPPFSKLDLVCCRNLLIYLEPELQKKIVPSFHYGLKTEGFLFLGASETVGNFVELFEPLERKHKIFAKKPGASRPVLSVPQGLSDADKVAPGKGLLPVAAANPAKLNLQKEADRLTLARFAPPGVVINEALEVVQFRGNTSQFLQPPTGRASFNLLNMAREGLMLPLRAAIQQAKKSDRPVRRENVPVRQNGHSEPVNFEVLPVKHLKEKSFLIFFELARAGAISPESPSRSPSRRGKGPSQDAAEKEGSRRASNLERELAETREYLQSIREQADATNEELQAANEEAQSANEELQSINEELETSKEELESANEELHTVNDELNHRNADLTQLSGDLVNFQASTHMALVLVGRDLAVRRFTPLAEKLFNLRDTDVGRLLFAVRHNLVFPPTAGGGAGATGNLEQMVKEAIDTGGAREREVQDKDDSWYSLRVRPYLTLSNKIEGAVITLVDIQALKQSERAAQQARDYAEGILRSASSPLVVLRPDFRVNTANDAFYKTFQATPAETEGRLIYEIGNQQWNIPKLRELLGQVLPRTEGFRDVEVAHNFESIGRRTMLLNARPLATAEGQFILLGIDDITEHRLQAVVRASETRFRRLFESALDGILILDLATQKTININPFCSQLLDRPIEELLGKELWEIGLFEDAQACQQAFRQMEQTGHVRLQKTVSRRDGEHRYLDALGNIYEETGRQIAQFNLRDITERKQTQERLRQSEERFRRVVNDVQDYAIFTLDLQGRVTSWNDGAQRTLGYAAEEVVGRSFARFFTREDVEAHRPERELEQAAREGRAEDDNWIVRKDGVRRWATGVTTLLRDDAGQPRGFSKVARDITERRQAEEELALRAETLQRMNEQLQESQQRFRTLAETLPQLVWTCPPDGKCDYFNAQWFEYTGLPLEKLLDDGWRQVMHPDDRQDTFDYWLAALKGDVPYDLEYRLRRADGQYRWFKARAIPLRDNAARITKWFGTCTDIEDQRQAQDTLEKKIAERTARLREALAELEGFSYSMSHDMRAPLRAMVGFANLVLEEPLSAEAQDHLRRIIEAGNRLDLLIRDVLAYSRVSRVELHMAPVDLERLIHNVIQQYGGFQPARVEIQSPLLPVLGHEAALTQCVANLLSNAVKFVEPGTAPHIKIWTEAREQNVRVWFADNGIGIDPDNHRRIFSMFERVHSPQEFDGTGIGLTIVRKAAERMGGMVGVESALGKGSKFWIQLKGTEANDKI